MNELILIRHGEAEHLVGDDDTRLTGGWTDTRLTDNGCHQAMQTGSALTAHVKGKPFNFYASDLIRCRQTAEMIGQVLAAQPKFTAELRELNNGLAANRTRKEAKEFAIPMTNPLVDWTPFLEAESWGLLHNRVARFMERIKEDAHDTTVIVAHGGSMINIIHWWLGIPREMFSHISYDIEPCSITKLTINEYGEKTISKLNDTCHLHE